MGYEALFLLFIVSFWFAQYLIIPYLTIFLMDAGTTAFIAGVVAGAYGFVQIFIRMPIGAMTDQISRPVLLIRCGCLVMVISTLLMCSGRDALSFFFARLIAGISAASWVVTMSLYVGAHLKRAKTKSLGRSTAAQYAGILLAFLVAGAIRSAISMGALLYVNVAIAVLSLFLSLFLRDDAVRYHLCIRRPSLGERLLIAAHNKQLFHGSLLFFFSQFVVFSSALSFTANYAEEQGIGEFYISVLAALFSISTLVSSMLIDRGIEHIVANDCAAKASFVLMAVSCAIIPVANSIVLICIMQILCGFSYGIHCSVLNGFAIESVRPEEEATAIGYFQGMHCIAITVAPMIMGKLIDLAGGYKIPYWMLTGVSLLAASMTGLFYKVHATE